jgi:maltose alpha-D-glucosyltransferase/alpha-amylase
MSIDDLWYKNAVIYCLDVEKYQDANGDGVGDFEGLMRRLDYLQGLGVTCVWLQPFYGSPNRDNGYDVADYYSVHEKHGSLGDFVEFMNRADALGIRVIVDLVVNHTSVDCPWFKQARLDHKSFYRDWYVWADQRPKDHKEGIVFPGQQTTTWTFDRTAGQYYFHRFYSHQPDLNTWNPYVREEHGILAAARSLRLPSGRRAVPHSEEGTRDRMGPGLHALEGDARVPSMAER